MVKVCSTCGIEVPEHYRFCGSCGSLVQASPAGPWGAGPAAEERSSRRLVTILFADLTNFTRAASRVDPEELYLTIRRSFERLAHSVRRLGGRIDRYVGDGFLATFGVPEAHENDPARALLAALEMQRSMKDLRAEASQSLGWEVQLRVGVNTGPVISGQIDTGSMVDTSVFGHAVNVANRLQQAARPGTVLVTEAIYRHTRAKFNFLEPVKLHLKGIDKPVVGYELVAQRLDPQPSRGLSGRSTPLVGRSAEFEALIAGLQRVQVDRTGMIALVTGQAGIGKTRLVEEVLAPLSEHFTIIRTECSPTEAPSYGLLTNILENLAGILPNDAGAVRQRRMEDLLAPSATLAREIGPVLSDLVGGQASRERRIGDPQQHERRILAATRRLFAWMALRKAVLLVFDDLQWADPSSLNVLSHAADLVHEVPLALIAIARSAAREDLPNTFVEPDPVHPGSFQDIHLQPLSPEESDRLVTLLLSKVALPAALKSNIVRRGDGNPLLIEELVRMLFDQGVIRATPEGWQIEEQWLATVEKVPDTVNGLILSRYDRLPPALKRILDGAAVLGRSFSLPLLVAMTEMDESELRRQLAVLEQADFIRRPSRSGVPVYYFRHALMQEGIYQTILQGERKELHLWAAEVIQQKAKDLALESAALIGHHLERAESPKAIAYLMQAAAQAADRYANQEAIVYYQRIQALLDQYGTRQDQAVDVALGLADLLARTNQLDEASGHLDRAKSLSSAPPAAGYRLGDVHYQLGRVSATLGAGDAATAAFEAAAANLEETPLQRRSFSLSDTEREIGWVLCRQGKLAEARVRAEKALSLAMEESDLRAVASAYNLLTPVHYWAGQLSKAVESAQESLAIRDQMGDIWASAGTQTSLGHLYHRLGEWGQAESFLRQAIFVQQEIGDHTGLVSSSNNLGLLLLESGRFDEALDWLNQAIAALRRGKHHPDMTSQLYGNRALVWLNLGDAPQARADLDRCLEAASQARNDDFRALALAYMADVELTSDNLQRAQELLHQSWTFAETNDSPEIRAEILRVQSRVLEADQQWSRALESNREAQVLYKQIGNRYEIARLQTQAAEIKLSWHHHDKGIGLDADVQREVLGAFKVFRELHAEADIPRAEDLLVRISALLAPALAEEPDSARRPVVIVHVRLRSPALSDERWAEQEIVASTFNRLTTELKRVGRSHGAVVATSGSGLSFLFSDPEPDGALGLALNAVASAQASIDVGIRLNLSSQRHYGVETPLSIGIVAGRWQGPIGDPQQAAIFANVSPIGQQAEAAAALSSENSILLAGEVAEYVRAKYELNPVEYHSGGRLPAPVYGLGPARAETKLPQKLPGSSARLIGRDTELLTLTNWLDRIRVEPQGRVCYLEAEAGMGKTRLLEEALAYARPDVLCLLGKCESFRSSISYWPFIDMLEHGPLPDTPASRRLKSLLALGPPDEADDSLVRSLPPADLRQELFARVRELFLREASDRPLLVVVEDIHALDLSSLDLLDFLLPLTLQGRISLLLVARAEMPGPHRALVNKAERVCQDRYVRIAFSSLTESESRALVRDLLETQTVPANLWEMLVAFSGHPLSIEEALRFLVERGWLWRSNGRWQLAGLEHSLDRSVPTTFKDLLLGRLDALDSETLHIFQAAAVLGETVDRTALGHVIPGPALASRLAELVDRGWLLAEKPDSPHLYHFKHTLTRETIYDTLLTSKRQVLHQRAGEAIETLNPEAEDENVELLAHHFAHSSLREKSLHYLVRAADKSATRHALPESLGYYQQAKELLPQCPNLGPGVSPKVALGLADVHLALGEPTSAIADLSPLLERSAHEITPEIQAASLRRLGTARREMGELPAALEHFQAALSSLAAEFRGQIHGLVADSAREEAWAAELGMAATLFDMRENQSAQEHAEKVLADTDRQLHPKLTAEALSLLGGIAYRREDAETAAQMVQQSLSIHQMCGNRSGAGSAYANLGILAAAEHDPPRARDSFALSLAIREALGDSLGTAITRNNLGQLERNRGRFEVAAQHLEVAAETARRSELTQVLAQSLANLGQVLTLTGSRPEALATLDEAESLCKSYGYQDLRCEVLWKRADCLIEGDDLAAAEAAASSAADLAADLGSHGLRSEAQRALARAYRRMGRLDRALEESAAAWEARAQAPDPATRARFAAEYALALVACDRQREARELLMEAVDSVELHESPAVMQEISEALETARAQGQAPPDTPT